METQVRLKLTLDSQNRLHKYVKGTGLEKILPKKEYHLTLYYTETVDLENIELDKETIHEGYVIGYRFTSDEDPQELVLDIFSPSIFNRHKEIVNLVNSKEHNEFIPHVAIKYSPKLEDMKYISDNLPLGMTLKFITEYIEIKY